MPFSVETFGRWGPEALEFLRDAAEVVCERSLLLSFLGSWGPVALLGAWHARLSIALQKGNAACVLQAVRIRGAEDLGVKGLADHLEAHGCCSVAGGRASAACGGRARSGRGWRRSSGGATAQWRV